MCYIANIGIQYSVTHPRTELSPQFVRLYELEAASVFVHLGTPPRETRTPSPPSPLPVHDATDGRTDRQTDQRRRDEMEEGKGSFSRSVNSKPAPSLPPSLTPRLRLDPFKNTPPAHMRTDADGRADWSHRPRPQHPFPPLPARARPRPRLQVQTEQHRRKGREMSCISSFGRGRT